MRTLEQQFKRHLNNYAKPEEVEIEHHVIGREIIASYVRIKEKGKFPRNAFYIRTMAAFDAEGRYTNQWKTQLCYPMRTPNDIRVIEEDLYPVSTEEDLKNKHVDMIKKILDIFEGHFGEAPQWKESEVEEEVAA